MNIPKEEVLVGRTQVRNQFKRAMKKAEQEHKQKTHKGWVCFKFDGRTDRDSLLENNRRSTDGEEHVTFIAEPDGQFLDFVNPHNKEASTLCLLDRIALAQAGQQSLLYIYQMPA